MKILISILLGGMLSSGFVFANEAEQNAKFLHEFVDGYQKFNTLGDLVAAANISVGDYSFFKRKIRGMEKVKPAEVREVNGALQFITKELTVSIKPISLAQGRFELNGKKISLLNLSPMAKWELLATALPQKKKSASVWGAVLPQAEANTAVIATWASRMGTALMLGLGISGSVTSNADFFSNNTNKINELCAEVDGALSNCRGVASQVELERQTRAVNLERLKQGKPPVSNGKNVEQAVAGAKATGEVAEKREEGKVEECAEIALPENHEKLDNKVLAMVTDARKAKRKAAQLFASCEAKDPLEECVKRTVIKASGMCAKAGYAAWFPEAEKEKAPEKAVKADNPPTLAPGELTSTGQIDPVDGVQPPAGQAVPPTESATSGAGAKR